MFSKIRALLQHNADLQEACQLIEAGKIRSLDVINAVRAVEQSLHGSVDPLIRRDLIIQFEAEYSVYKELLKYWN